MEEITFQQKVAAILSTGTLGSEGGKFIFVPNDEHVKTYDTKKGYKWDNADLISLVNSMFIKLLSTRKGSL